MASSKRTLVTGFGPFRDVEHNPSASIAESLGRPFAVLDVSYEAVEKFLSEVDTTSFDALLMLGVAAGRSCLCPELLAHNAYAVEPDVRGVGRSGEIRLGGPGVLRSTLFDESGFEGIPGLQTSRDAGRYLCNFAYYKALDRLPKKRVGFLHVPPFERVSRDDQLAILRDLLDRLEL